MSEVSPLSPSHFALCGLVLFAQAFAEAVAKASEVIAEDAVEAKAK